MTLSILGMGAAHPPHRLSNDFIVGIGVETTIEWVREKIGIEERVTSLRPEYIRATKNEDPTQAIESSDDTPTTLATRAARQACERAGIAPSQLGLIIANTCTPRATIPCEAARIAEQLRVTAQAFDVYSACPAFALHIDYLRHRSEQSLPEYVLCVSTATMTQHVNYADRTDPSIWADGAAAFVVSAQHPGRLRVVTSTFMADPTRSSAVTVDTYGHFHQDGRAVRDFSVRQTVRMIKAFEDEYQIDWSRDVFIGHQANATMLEQITNNRGIPTENHWTNVRITGNQAGASASAVLSQHWDKIRPGMRIVVAVVGAGLSWGSILFEASEQR